MEKKLLPISVKKVPQKDFQRGISDHSCPRPPLRAPMNDTVRLFNPTTMLTSDSGLHHLNQSVSHDLCPKSSTINLKPLKTLFKHIIEPL